MGVDCTPGESFHLSTNHRKPPSAAGAPKPRALRESPACNDDVIDWQECDPGKVGIDGQKLAAAIRLVEARGAAAQLCTIRHGQLVLNRSFGCDPRSLFWIFSASKPYLAVLTHLLAERNLISLDDPLSLHWPEFAAQGKAALTIRHVLQHRTGLADNGTTFGEVLALADWRRSVRRIESANPRWPAGEVPAYQPLSYGFILGELIQRVTHRPLPEVLATELLQPLGASDTYLGLPKTLWNRRVPVVAPGIRGLIAQAIVNSESIRRAVIPAAGISTTAGDLARLYFMLLRSGSFAGVRILSPNAVMEARVPSSDGEIDRTVNVDIRWSNGFQLGGPRSDPRRPRPFGQLSSPRAFGHNGSNCCVGWSDPDRDLVFAYLTNRLPDRQERASHIAAVADAMIAACS